MVKPVKHTKVKILPKVTTTEEARAAVNKQSSNLLLFATLGVIAVLVVASVGMLMYVRSNNIKESGNGVVNFFASVNNRLFSPAAKAQPAAIVNSEEITMSELDTQYNRLPDYYKGVISKDSLLSKMIDEKLLLQKAAADQITVSDEEVSGLITSLLDQNAMTEDELKTRLAEQNISYDELRDFYRKELIITKLVNESVLKSINVSDQEIRDYYANHTAEFTIPESINVSHILICHNNSTACANNRTKEEALALAEKVRSMINSTNYEEIAKVYSDEPGANETAGNLPGYYISGFVTKEDPYDKTFMDAAFNLTSGEVSPVVETAFGYHVIKVFKRNNATEQPLDNVTAQIRDAIRLERQQTAFTDFLDGLRKSATIVNYINQTAQQ